MRKTMQTSGRQFHGLTTKVIITEKIGEYIEKRIKKYV
jgi:hypothetical protein